MTELQFTGDVEITQRTPEEINAFQWECFSAELHTLREMLRTRENAQPIIDQLKPMYESMSGSSDKYEEYQARLNKLIEAACNLPVQF